MSTTKSSAVFCAGLVGLSFCISGGCGSLGPEDIPAQAEPIITFNGEWLSEQFAYAIEIKNRTGVLTLANSSAVNVGDVVLVIESVDEMMFHGQMFANRLRQESVSLTLDGIVQGVIDNGATQGVVGRMSGPNTLTLTGAGITWNLIRISPFNFPPEVNAGEDMTVSLEVGSVDLAGTVSDDGEPGDVLTSTWSLVSGPSEGEIESEVAFEDPSEPETKATFTEAGEYELQLEASDGEKVTSATVTVIVAEPVSSSTVRLETSLGDIVLELFAEEAPVTSANFVQYVEDGFYDGTIFHRVVPDFAVQGGGFLPENVEPDGLRDPIVNEFSAERSNVRGTVAMAKQGGDPDSATSQFFFNLADNSANLDTQNGGFTVFATVVEGMDVVDAMAAVELDGETPLEDIVLVSATLE